MTNDITKPLANAVALSVLALSLGACALDESQSQVQTPPAVTVSQTGPCCGPITPAARNILKVLDESDVENLWSKHRHVNWETGVPDEPADYKGREADTHCSALAAAMGERVGVYMLRPPGHAQELLANAQTAWFDSTRGRKAGWYSVDTPEQAQALANMGKLVVVSYQSPDPHHSGHIGIVRASDRTEAQIRKVVC